MSVITEIRDKIKYKLFQVESDRKRGEFRSLFSYIESCQLSINQLGANNGKTPKKDGKDKIRKIKAKVQKLICKLTKERDKLSSKGKDVSNINSRISELNKAISELNILETSTTNYKFKRNSTAPQINYKGENTIEIQHGGNLGSILHELHHAFQYETGKIDFIKTQDGTYEPGFLYDKTDELSAYQREVAANGFLKYTIKFEVAAERKVISPSSLHFENGELFEIKEIRLMSQVTLDVIIKIAEPKNGNLYERISSQELNKDSPMSSVITNNSFYRNNTLDIFEFNKKRADRNSSELNDPYIEFVKIFIDKTPGIYVKE